MRRIAGILILILTLIVSVFATVAIYRNQTLISKKLQIIAANLPWRKNSSINFISPLGKSDDIHQETPIFEKYSLPNLKQYPFQTSEIIVTELEQKFDEYSQYLFEYQTMGKKMTGVVNLPAKVNQTQPLPVIILVRGYVEKAHYYPGLGTQNAAAVFAKNGYVTLAPDFFGFAQADTEPDNPWEARFVKPINVVELLKSLQTNPEIKFEAEDSQNDLSINPEKIGIWAHSNGGQITLSVLEVLSEPIPSTLWAPVTAPFPYSIMFFTRTNEDEGKEARAWLAMFEKEYDVADFTITQHLDQLTGPIQIHHGSADEAALQVWSEDFSKMIEQENKKREEENQESEDTEVESSLVQPITFNYFSYPGADHNLQPSSNWNTAITRDLEFFDNYFNQN